MNWLLSNRQTSPASYPGAYLNFLMPLLIAQSMKVVASTKLTRAERAMREAKKYGAANNELFKNTTSDDASSANAPKILYLAMTSDGGLCGGIHSGITRAVKREQAKESGAVVVVGDKPRAQLSRAMPEQFRMTFGGVGKDVPTFAEASIIADQIMKNGGDFDEVSTEMFRLVPYRWNPPRGYPDVLASCAIPSIHREREWRR